MLTSTMSRRPRDLRAVLATLGGRRPIATHSNKALFEWYARSLRERCALAVAIQWITRREFGYDLRVPETPVAGAKVAAGLDGEPVDALEKRLERFDAEFDEALSKCPYLARIEHQGTHECVFRYCDSTKSYDPMQVTYHVRTHEHHLVQTRVRKLTDQDVVLPPKQQQMVAALPTSVLPSVQIITGMLIQQEEGDGGTVVRDHAAGRVMRQAAQAAVKYGPRAVAGVAAGAAAAGLVIGIGTAIKAATAVAIVAAADPAVVIGDLVLSGWLEE